MILTEKACASGVTNHNHLQLAAGNISIEARRCDGLREVAVLGSTALMLAFGSKTTSTMTGISNACGEDMPMKGTAE
jgi:hypothetical protein